MKFRNSVKTMYKPTNELKIEIDIDENKITETSQKNTKKSIKKKNRITTIEL